MGVVQVARLGRFAALSLLLAAIAVVAVTSSLERGIAATGCLPEGVVMDQLGRPVTGIHLRLSRGPELLNTATDEAGRYDFNRVAPRLRSDEFADATLSLELLVEGTAGVAPRFQILHRQQLPTRRVTLEPDSGDCVTDFDFGSGALPGAVSEPTGADWPSLIELYQRTDSAWRLLDQLGIAEQVRRPFRIYSSCDEPALGCPETVPGTPSDFAAFVVGIGDGPYVVLGERTSELDHGNAPDNREYHELGHLAHYLLTSGQIPVDPENVNHGGYYGNPSSTDSWVEGFASFFSMMVSKQVDGDPAPERFRLFGAEYDLEADHRAWEWSGWWEELAVAGLLLDVEDGDEDYQSREPARELSVLGSRTIDLDGVLGVAGEVRNTSTRVIGYSEVTVELLDASGAVTHRTATPVLVSSLAPGDEGEFLAPIPPYFAFASVRVTPGPMYRSDDDPVDVTLEELVAAIRGYASSHPLGAGQLFDIADLHTALSEAFGGSDRDGDGVDDIDQLFIAHGFFANADGTRPLSPTAGVEVGLTSHPAFQGYPASIPRREVPVSAESTVMLDVSDVNVLVHVQLAESAAGRSYGYVYPVGGTGEILLPAPSRLSASTLTLITLPAGEAPRLLGQASAADLWDRWDSTPGSAVDFGAVTSVPVAPAVAPASAEAASGGPSKLVLALVVLAGMLTAVAYGWVLVGGMGRRG